ncbi:hypothetical protein GCM10018952_37550 [Streptosporangium vulgare]
MIGAAMTGADTPLAASTSYASTHSSLSGRLARTARVHDRQWLLAAKRARKPHSPGSRLAGTCSGAAGLSSERRP